MKNALKFIGLFLYNFFTYPLVIILLYFAGLQVLGYNSPGLITNENDATIFTLFAMVAAFFLTLITMYIISILEE